MNSLVATPFVVPMLLGIKWLDPEWLQHEYGTTFIWIAIAIVFVECGLFFPFLPGDTLLFALGLFISTGKIDLFGSTDPFVEMLLALTLLSAAGFLGNVVGYEIGRAIGPPLYERDGRFLQRKHFDQTEAFFDKHGSKALVVGRFVPFVRTFITVVAGVTRMHRRKFLTWSFVGAILWVASILLLGYFLGGVFPSLGDKIDLAILAILAFSVIPVAFEWWRHRRTHSPEAEDNDHDGVPDIDIIGGDTRRRVAE